MADRLGSYEGRREKFLLATVVLAYSRVARRQLSKNFPLTDPYLAPIGRIYGEREEKNES